MGQVGGAGRPGQRARRCGEVPRRSRSQAGPRSRRRRRPSRCRAHVCQRRWDPAGRCDDEAADVRLRLGLRIWAHRRRRLSPGARSDRRCQPATQRAERIALGGVRRSCRHRQAPARAPCTCRHEGPDLPWNAPGVGSLRLGRATTRGQSRRLSRSREVARCRRIERGSALAGRSQSGLSHQRAHQRRPSDARGACVATLDDVRTDFIKAATWHGSLENAEAILAAHPELRSEGGTIHIAAIQGDDAAVRRFITQDPGSVNAKCPPYGGDALTYLGLSKYLRLDRSRTAAFVRAATTLLDAGADPNTGFWTTGKSPERETALYGAAGVAHHPELTRLLLERGADPNDEEVVYHSPEGYDLEAMKLVVETGRVTTENLCLMLVRKHD